MKISKFPLSALCGLSLLALTKTANANPDKLHLWLEDSGIFSFYAQKLPEATTLQTEETNTEQTEHPVAEAAQKTPLAQETSPNTIALAECYTLAGYFHTSDQHQITAQFTNYAQRLKTNSRHAMRQDLLTNVDLPEEAHQSPQSPNNHFKGFAKNLHDYLKEQGEHFNSKKTSAFNQTTLTFNPDRPAFFFARHLLKGVFDNESDAFVAAYNHAKQKTDMYKNLIIYKAMYQDQNSFLAREEKIRKTFQARFKQSKQGALNACQFGETKQREAVEKVDVDFTFEAPDSLAKNLEQKRAKWQRRQEVLGRLCIKSGAQIY